MKKMTKKEIQKIKEDVSEFIKTKLLFEDVGTALNKTYTFVSSYEAKTELKNYGINVSVKTSTVDLLLDFEDGTSLAFTVYAK